MKWKNISFGFRSIFDFKSLNTRGGVLDTYPTFGFLGQFFPASPGLLKGVTWLDPADTGTRLKLLLLSTSPLLMLLFSEGREVIVPGEHSPLTKVNSLIQRF